MSDRIRLRFAPCIIIALLVTGCSRGSNTGPAEIHWNRQTCEHCQMVISEERHAAQVRLHGDRQAHAFDDLGCGLLWLDEQGLLAGDAEGPEVWVKESADTDWIDARKARFTDGLSTPMAYGFGVASAGISIAEAQAEIRRIEKHRRTRTATGHKH